MARLQPVELEEFVPDVRCPDERARGLPATPNGAHHAQDPRCHCGRDLHNLVSLLESEQRLSALARTLPLEASTFYLWLTEEDKSTLKQIASHAGDCANEDELLQALKEKSPRLYEKAIELHHLVKAKIESLTPEAKAFAETAVEKVRSLWSEADQEFGPEKVRKTVQDIVKQFGALSAEAQGNLAVAFPVLVSSIVLPPSSETESVEAR
ncbi:hypothetical protein ACIQU8_21975 [Streptomyces griseus]|uniref:hypothetical protein n=1 Tax=Streptomyces griseus TaxID=1911 RepID=UPI00381138E8